MYETQKVKQTSKASKQCQAVQAIPLVKLCNIYPSKTLAHYNGQKKFHKSKNKLELF
jgi:hypothetical protein